MKHLNLLKAIASPRWGTKTIDLIPLVNSTIHGVIDYACSMYGNAARSDLGKLDVIYNASFCFATFFESGPTFQALSGD